jgi:hypothetical protein
MIFTNYLNQLTKDKLAVEARRLKTLFFIILVLIVLAFGLALINFFTGGGLVRSITFTLFSLLLISNIFVMRKNAKWAGNVFALSITIASVFSLNITGLVIPYYLSFVSGFYIFFGILMIAGMFSTRLVSLANSGIILFGVVLMFFRAKDLFVGVEYDMLEIGKTGFTRFLIIFAVAAFIMDYLIRNNHQMIEQVYAEKELKEKQNQVMSNVIRSLEKTVSFLNTFVADISGSTTNMRDNTAKQADSINEISVTLEQLSQFIAENAQKAHSSIGQAKETDILVKTGGNSLSKSLQSVKAINRKTEAIIDLAERTDILAINASIEASRAGEAGRGFAVVAGEIRKLSEFSHRAAREITDLVESNISLSDEAAKALNAIISQVSSISASLITIANASLEQSAGIEQINRGMAVLNSSAQSYHELAEHIATAMQTLQLNVQELQSLVEID